MKLKINNRFYTFFDEVKINRTLDSIASSISLKARFNPDNIHHREIFKPLQYHLVELFDDNDDLLFTGYIVNNSFSSKNIPELKNLSGYSLGGILEDVTIPFSNYPLERNNVSLSDLAKQVLRPFGISFLVSSNVSRDMNLPYETTVAEPSETVKSYLSKLAAQRNIILSHDEKGRLLFTRPDIKAKPKLFLNIENTNSMSLAVNGQGIHSEISVIRQPSFGNDDLTPVDSVVNSMVGKFKPMVKVLTSGTDTDTSKAANNVLASELKNISISAEVSKYLYVNPGDIVEVINPEIYLYNNTRLMIQSISVAEKKDSTFTSLKLVLPETFTGDSPVDVFD